MLGEMLVLGVASAPFEATVRGAGTANRITAADFAALLAGSRTLQRVVNEYLYRMLATAITSVPCTRFHSVEERLARWLLMADDRMRTGRMRLTHEIVAGVLGVRRSAVTIAAAALQSSGIISYSRGRIRIVSRARLKAAACGCYHPLTRP
jgi:CRP-like cAMP-binding protein